jgi:hypothetical protein
LITPVRSTSFSGRVVIDRDGTFRRAYRAKPGTALLIRPDGYLHWRARTPCADAVAKHVLGAGAHPHPLPLPDDSRARERAKTRRRAEPFH